VCMKLSRVDNSLSRYPAAILDKFQWTKPEEGISAVVDLIQERVNPFSDKQDLINISTARKAHTDIKCDLMKAHEIGEQSYIAFKEERLELHVHQESEDIQQSVQKEGSEVKWEDYHLNSRQVAFWSNHSNGTRTQSEDGRCLASPSWTITLGFLNT